jgi:predicted RNA-binding protein YlqC (UPF0109 family)
MSSIDQQFVEFIVKSLVGNPDAVQIERRIDEKGVLLELTVDPEDLGRVIGKRGATAQSLRTLLRALGTKNEARYNLKIIDNGEPRPPREDNRDSYRNDDRHDDSVNHNDSGQEELPTAQTPVTAQSNEKHSWTTTPAKVAEDRPAVSNEERNHDSMINQTRKELEDLDDLDL